MDDGVHKEETLLAPTPKCTDALGNICILAFPKSKCTVDTGYMVIGYKVKSGIRSILGWYGFPYTKSYWIYGQISDIWSDILIKLKTKAIGSGVF